MQVKARFVKTSPQKIRLVIDAIRGLTVPLALAKLEIMNNQASLVVTELVKSALAAVSEKSIEKENLYISKIFCDEGPKLKRRHYRSRGRASQILKRMSHITLILSEKDKKNIKKI